MENLEKYSAKKAEKCLEVVKNMMPAPSFIKLVIMVKTDGVKETLAHFSKTAMGGFEVLFYNAMRAIKKANGISLDATREEAVEVRAILQAFLRDREAVEKLRETKRKAASKPAAPAEKKEETKVNSEPVKTKQDATSQL